MKHVSEVSSLVEFGTEPVFQCIKLLYSLTETWKKPLNSKRDFLFFLKHIPLGWTCLAQAICSLTQRATDLPVASCCSRIILIWFMVRGNTEESLQWWMFAFSKPQVVAHRGVRVSNVINSLIKIELGRNSLGCFRWKGCRI